MPKLPRPRAAALAALLAAVAASSASAEMLCVTTQKANVRSAPGARASIVWQSWRYNPLEVLGKRGRWFQVTDFYGEEGWVHENVVDHMPAVMVSAELANVREGPGLHEDAVWEVEQGYSFLALERRGRWLKVKDGGNVSGWIHISTVWGVTDPAAYRGVLDRAAVDPG